MICKAPRRAMRRNTRANGKSVQFCNLRVFRRIINKQKMMDGFGVLYF